MQNQKSKLKIEIQKSNSKMGIVLINSKTKFNFSSGLAFLFCEAIITQPFGFVNKRKKIFFMHIYTTSYIAICRYRINHIYIDTIISIPTYIYTQLDDFACIYWWVNGLMHQFLLCVYMFIRPSKHHSTHPQSTEFCT